LQYIPLYLAIAPPLLSLSLSLSLSSSSDHSNQKQL
jgi:hypothetical protein